MAQFVIHAWDKPDSLTLRLANRPAHLDYLSSIVSMIACAGPFLSENGDPIGSLLIVNAPDRATIDQLLANDPYTKAGLFERVDIFSWKQVIPALS